MNNPPIHRKGDKETNEVRALIRPGGRKCYVLLTKEFCELNKCHIDEQRLNTEALIWDFETPVGQFYEGVIQYGYYECLAYELDNIEILSESQYEYDGCKLAERKIGIKENYSENLIIEGIGGDGYIFGPFLGVLIDCYGGGIMYLFKLLEILPMEIK